MSAALPMSEPIQMTSTLTLIRGGTAFEWESQKADAFNKWLETTAWAGKLPENLAGQPRSNNLHSLRCDSKLRTAVHWAHLGQAAKAHNGEPFLFCLDCNGTLQHPSVFNLGTTDVKTHLTSRGCMCPSGRTKNSHDILTMLETVSLIIRIHTPAIVLMHSYVIYRAKLQHHNPCHNSPT